MNLISKVFSLTIFTASLLLIPSTNIKNVLAGTCVAQSSCNASSIQFVPGEWITIEVVNMTANVIEVLPVSALDAVPMTPGQTLSLIGAASTEPNFSLTFSDVSGLPLKVDLSKPEARKLRIEVRPGNRPPGDRSLYLKNDGHLQLM